MARTEARRRLPWSGCLLGFALGGFFDGILLHQILQWHHLLSAINGENLRFQVAADGYFHAAMYFIAAAGLVMLWSSRRDLDQGSGRLLFAAILIGFGTWHVADTVMSHWLLGIHRIRMDRPNPLFWDLLWLGLFGIAPLIIGWVMKRGRGNGETPVSNLPATGRALVTLFVIGAGALGLWPLRSNEFTTVLFAPGAGQERIINAIASVDAQMVWVDPSGELAVVRLGEGESVWALFRHGAILVTGAGLPAGCLNYLRT